jgi:acid phosphatase family membrane protein YuiD
MDLSILFSNHLLNTAVLSWCSAQIIKTLTDAISHRKFDKKRLAGAGGMPSSHSAVVCSLVLMSLLTYGYSSAPFAFSFVLALIVMYDATGVRWHAGLHARAINNIVNYLSSGKLEDSSDLNSLIPKLNESLGHRVIEVVCGALLGFAVSSIYELFLLHIL